MSGQVVLAVDGGNSKTDLVLVGAEGRLLAHARGPQSSPHHLGLGGCLDVLQALFDQACSVAGLTPDGRPVAEVGHVLLAGVDFPGEEQELLDALSPLRWAERLSVGNDTFAVLRAGTERGWGVAVVCGAGINCVGVAPDGRQVRFPALGAITGDWGGGFDVGLAALSAAARSEDGRGPRTSLEHAVPEHFGLATPLELAQEMHRGRIDVRRVHELAPLVFAEAADDDVAGAIVDRLAEEVVALAGAALHRLDLDGQAVEVALGGGLIRAGDARLLTAIEAGLRAVDPLATVHATLLPPVVGAALLGLDELGSGADAQERIRRELATAVGADEDDDAAAPVPASVDEGGGATDG
jgi:N-acetylglucosamine kinase-like BadF-type ATPase